LERTLTERQALWALLFGNFVIGTGVMLVPGMLNIMAADMQVSVPTAGTLVSVAAIVMCIGAPTLATLTGAWDRRTLLTASLVIYAVGHALCALMPDFAALLPVRAAIMIGAAIFTPQAAATLGLMLPVERSAAAITFIFLGWSMASVLGLPLAVWLGAQLGWRGAFGLFAAVAAVSAWAVWRAIPQGIRGVTLNAAAWLQVARHPSLKLILLVTLLSASGQFTVWAYIAPFTQWLLQPSPAMFSGLLVWLGVFGVVGNVLATRAIGVRGPGFNVHVANGVMLLGMALLMPLGAMWWGFMLCATLWGLGIFAANSSPELAGASIALNTSMIYLGQAAGTTMGGVLIASAGYAPLPGLGAAILLLAVTCSLCLSRRMEINNSK
jgi:predicted MFS family arabinose efflux permease